MLKLNVQTLFLILFTLLINQIIAFLITQQCKLYSNREIDKVTIKNTIRKSINPLKLYLTLKFLYTKNVSAEWTDTLTMFIHDKKISNKSEICNFW